MRYVPFAGFGPYESYEADHMLQGGERLELAGFEIDVLFTPGHSPGHLTFSIPAERAIFSGDVLFQGSVGRTDLPGGDWDTLLASIGDAGRVAARGHDRLSGPHGDHDARRRAPHEPVPGRAGGGRILTLPAGRRAGSRPPSRKSLDGREVPGPARDLRPAARAGAALRARDRRRGAGAARGAGFGQIETPGLRGHRAVRAHGRRGDRHRAQGDVHVRRTAAAAR